MASAVNSDEQRPLLSTTQVEEGPFDPSGDDSGDIDAPPHDTKELTWGWYAFYGASISLALLGITLLIKGFIDAGDTDFDLADALQRALGGGLSGAAAMILQVFTLMPLRTIMNYQYRYGTPLREASRTLYNDGGWTRYYQGLPAALIQGPVSRFGDTAANAGILALFESNSYLKNLPSLLKTGFASLAAAAFRILLTPIDTVKTTLQTQGRNGIKILKDRVRKYGVTTLWYGALASAAATLVGHYPWFGTYNYLEDHLPTPNSTLQKMARRAFMGFVASVVSDTISNSLRVVKTYRQVNETKIDYTAAARAVVAVDGLRGLLGRGLKIRILANGLQGLMFSVLWRFFMDLWDEKTKNGMD